MSLVGRGDTAPSPLDRDRHGQTERPPLHLVEKEVIV